MAARAIDDREPTMAQPGHRVKKESIAVGTAVSQRAVHSIGVGASVVMKNAVEREHATDAAHQVSLA
jgi:hypothetical protein